MPKRTDWEQQSVDLREIAGALRYGWYLVVAGALLGLALAFVASEAVPARYEAASKVLVRASPDLARNALSGLGTVGTIIGAGGVGASELNTELEILASHSMLGSVVDSLRLQAHVEKPAGLPSGALFERVHVAPGSPSRKFVFDRDADGYTITGERTRVTAKPGEAAVLPGAEVVLRSGDLPDQFVVHLRDRTDAIDAVSRSLRTRAITNDVAEVQFRANDPYTAAEVPNLLVAEYLRGRLTTERGTNQHRFEFLVGHTDSITVELARAEAALREHQEVSGVLDPRFMGQTQLGRAMDLQGELEGIEVESRALRRIVDADRAGTIPPRELAAYPSFLRNAAINDLLSRLLELETNRLTLLQRRTPNDPDVIAMTESIEHLEGQLRSLSSAYLTGLDRQRTEVMTEMAGYRTVLDRLPRQAEESLRRQREVERLSEIQLALHSQLVQARLAAIGEGGEVRQIDAAIPPKKQAFPSRGFVLLMGLFGGTFFGMVGAVGRGLLRQRIREPWEVELAAGVRAATFGVHAPLAFPEIRTARTLLLLPLGSEKQARAIGERIVETATLQGREAVLADLTQEDWHAQGEHLASRTPQLTAAAEGQGRIVVDLPAGAVNLPLYRSGGAERANRDRAMLAHLEERFSPVIAVVPRLDKPVALSLLSGDRPVLLVAGANHVTRSQLTEAVETVERFGGTVAGVVLCPNGNGRRD
jgi:tyrosine-protein kinase Etk/Wzc